MSQITIQAFNIQLIIQMSQIHKYNLKVLKYQNLKIKFNYSIMLKF